MNRRAFDVFVVVLSLAWLVACIAMVLLGGGCSVYEDPPMCGRAHPGGGGVTVNVRELADGDGGER